jgi:hypothetical protein
MDWERFKNITLSSPFLFPSPPIITTLIRKESKLEEGALLGREGK